MDDENRDQPQTDAQDTDEQKPSWDNQAPEAPQGGDQGMGGDDEDAAPAGDEAPSGDEEDRTV